MFPEDTSSRNVTPRTPSLFPLPSILCGKLPLRNSAFTPLWENPPLSVVLCLHEEISENKSWHSNDGDHLVRPPSHHLWVSLCPGDPIKVWCGFRNVFSLSLTLQKIFNIFIDFSDNNSWMLIKTIRHIWVSGRYKRGLWGSGRGTEVIHRLLCHYTL